MAYRLVCIYETFEHASCRMRVEVSLDKGKMVSRFERKVSIEQLYQDDAIRHSNLLPLLNHSGLSSQPFCIDEKLLQEKKVVDILEKQSWSFIQSRDKGSIKKGKCPLQKHSALIYPNGLLLGGELYINEMANWYRNILVRFRYDGSLTAFFPQFSELPYIVDGELYVRDRDRENEMLAKLGCGYDVETGTMTLNGFDIQTLYDLSENGWKIYVANSKDGYTSLKAHQNNSGIRWFSTEDYEESIFAQHLLDGFLHSRNYYELNGKITLFQKQDLARTKDETFLQQLALPEEVCQLYSPCISLSSSEVSQIYKTLSLNLNAQLRPYQLDGVQWLQMQRKNHHNCLLADEMGLGKTIQVLSHLLCLDTSNRHLIIAPTSLKFNWLNEIERFTPILSPQIDIVSYDMLRIHIEEYIGRQYDTIIIDEAQIIKNRDTKKYKTISQLQSTHKIIITGTPIENSVEEIWSLFIILIPELRLLYKKLYALNAQSVYESYIELTGRLLMPFILRRTKEKVLKDLPKIIQKTIYIELSEKERKVYNNVHTSVLQALRTGVTGRVNSLVLEALLRLRQACVSLNLLPTMFSHSKGVRSTKLYTALDYVKHFVVEGSKVLIFSQFVGALHEMEDILSNLGMCYVKLYGDTHNRQTVVEKFNQDSSVCVFLISLKAGGVGLNLTSADKVLLLDDWWNPAVEDQAMGRAHRLGQKNNVLVLRFVCRNTVEEKILLLQEHKRQTVDLFNGIKEGISIDEIRELVS